MDHVLERIEVFYQIYLDDFVDEHIQKKHKKLIDNSYYKELKAIIESMNPLRSFLGYEKMKLSEEIKIEIECRAERERSKI